VPGDALPVGASIQLVKVADGLVDPVNMVSAQGGSGRGAGRRRDRTYAVITQ
jgi:hypothetical protein